MIHRYKLTGSVKKATRHRQQDARRAASQRPAIAIDCRIRTWAEICDEAQGRVAGRSI